MVGRRVVGLIAKQMVSRGFGQPSVCVCFWAHWNVGYYILATLCFTPTEKNHQTTPTERRTETRGKLEKVTLPWNKFFLPFILLYFTLLLSLISDWSNRRFLEFFVTFDWLSRYYWFCVFWFVDFGVAWNANEFRTLLQSAFTVSLSGLFLEIFV